VGVPHILECGFGRRRSAVEHVGELSEVPHQRHDVLRVAVIPLLGAQLIIRMRPRPVNPLRHGSERASS